MPSFGGANALNDAGGFEVGKVLLYRFCRDAHLAGKRNGTQLAIFGKQGNGILPTFLRKVDSFVPSSIEYLDINMNFSIPFVFPPRVSNRLPCSLCLAADVDNHLCDIIGK